MRRVGSAQKGLLAWGAKYLPAHFSRAAVEHAPLAGREDRRHAHGRGVKINLLGPRGGAKSTIGTWRFRSARRSRAASRTSGSSPTRNTRPAPIWKTSRLNYWRTRRWPRIIRERRDGASVAHECHRAAKRGGNRGLRHRATDSRATAARTSAHGHHLRRPAERRAYCFGGAAGAFAQLVPRHVDEGRHPATNVVNLAAALHREALAMELAETPGWTSRIFKAIVRWPENTSLVARVGSHICGRGQPAL